MGRLAEGSGISRPVAREALKPLADRGIVNAVDGKGASVKPFDASALSSFFRRPVRTRQRRVHQVVRAAIRLPSLTAAFSGDHQARRLTLPVGQPDRLILLVIGSIGAETRLPRSWSSEHGVFPGASRYVRVGKRRSSCAGTRGAARGKYER